MATRKQYLEAILNQRTSWTTADRLQADQLAGLRFQLEGLRKQSEKAPATVATAAGGEKPHPIHAQAEKVAKQEAALTRRLGLGLKRTADNGRSYVTAAAPGELRELLFYAFTKDGLLGLSPGEWAFAVSVHSCDIDEDFTDFPDSPRFLPRSGEAPVMRGIFPPSENPSIPNWEQHKLPAGEVWPYVAALRKTFTENRSEIVKQWQTEEKHFNFT